MSDRDLLVNFINIILLAFPRKNTYIVIQMLVLEFNTKPCFDQRFLVQSPIGHGYLPWIVRNATNVLRGLAKKS